MRSLINGVRATETGLEPRDQPLEVNSETEREREREREREMQLGDMMERERISGIL